MHACTRGESYTPHPRCATSAATTHDHHEVDDTLERIGDKSLFAEVSRFRGTMDAMEHLKQGNPEHEEEMYSSGNDNRKCVRHLERAHALIRVFEEEEIANGLQVITLGW
jgi:hypothetical protein